MASRLLGNDLIFRENALPGLAALLTHPVCIEVIKAALQQVHSAENLVFYLHVQRYKRMHTVKLRKLLAACIHDHFIRADAPHQINLSTKMRDAITAAVNSKDGDMCTVDLFHDAEKEAMTLMNNNVFRSLPGNRLRLCSWILAVTPMNSLIESDSESHGDAHEEPTRTQDADLLVNASAVDT